MKFLDRIRELLDDPDRPSGVTPAQWAELKPRQRLPVTPHDKPFARCIFAGSAELKPLWMAYKFFGGYTVFGHGHSLDEALASLQGACEGRPIGFHVRRDGSLERVL